MRVADCGTLHCRIVSITTYTRASASCIYICILHRSRFSRDLQGVCSGAAWWSPQLESLLLRKSFGGGGGRPNPPLYFLDVLQRLACTHI